MPDDAADNGTEEKPPPGDEAWESRCRRCGACCHEKVRFGEQVVITDIPCPFLEPGSHLCRVYPERLVRQPRCASAKRSARMGALPGDCPYATDIPDYPAPHLLSGHPEYEEAVNRLFPERKCAKST
ncbi:MAG: hypothetical protein LBV15_00955 [Planctomycetota bacterium]|jgi:uncharacterized cysteine cluster protein YcgN (CxxCxxCC family)|nr:hypothetical protein [Planctomycetota bacterium]